MTSQGNSAIAIGSFAGNSSQGTYAIAIGANAGDISQANNSIILNASGGLLNQTTANTFTVKPVRQGETADAMYYNSSTGEITYAGVFSFNVAGDDSTQRLVSNNELIKFIGAGGVTTASDAEGNITITGNTGAITAQSFNTDQITVVGNRISTTVTNANLELECNGTGGVVINRVADATTASTVKSVGYLGLPQSATATDGTLAIGDAGKHIYVTTTGQAIAIPDNGSVAYPIGTTLTFIAGPSIDRVLIIVNGGSDTLRLAGSTAVGTRTLAANGMATAVKVASTLWYINGIGLT
jgi:hypothetical protein